MVALTQERSHKVHRVRFFLFVFIVGLGVWGLTRLLSAPPVTEITPTTQITTHPSGTPVPRGVAVDRNDDPVNNDGGGGWSFFSILMVVVLGGGGVYVLTRLVKTNEEEEDEGDEDGGGVVDQLFSGVTGAVSDVREVVSNATETVADVVTEVVSNATEAVVGKESGNQSGIVDPFDIPFKSKRAEEMANQIYTGGDKYKKILLPKGYTMPRLGSKVPTLRVILRDLDKVIKDVKSNPELLTTLKKGRGAFVRKYLTYGNRLLRLGVPAQVAGEPYEVTFFERMEGAAMIPILNVIYKEASEGDGAFIDNLKSYDGDTHRIIRLL